MDVIKLLLGNEGYPGSDLIVPTIGLGICGTPQRRIVGGVEVVVALRVPVLEMNGWGLTPAVI